MGSVRRSTVASYQSAWKRWVDWCSKRNLDTLSPSLAIVLDYLFYLFNIGFATASLNTHRSMLSMTVDPIEGHNVGEHPLVVQLLKGCYNLNPPKPRYDSFWDPDVVLNYFISSGPDGSLSLVSLSNKLAMLLALATLSRVSELCSISYSSISISDTGAKFSFSRLRKAQSSGPLKSCVLPRLNGLCCPVGCLESYISATREFRLPEASTLFLSLKRPHRPIRSSTLGHWLKSCLSDAGLSPDSFSAHSTRGAAASKAVFRGVPVELVLQSAHWSRESTFQRFYHRELSSISVSQAILSQPSSHSLL